MIGPRETQAGRNQDKIDMRAEVLYRQQRATVLRRIDRLFGVLMTAQWVFAVLLALLVSPYGWAGKTKVIHEHVQLAVFLGGALSAFPILLIWMRPGWVVTRHVAAAAQMLWSALLIHLSGGRIETHFHVFGSLAFLAFYLDWPVLVTATVLVAGDHFLRGVYWPESVYGINNPEWWRFLEHAGWVLFEDVILTMACINGVKDLKLAALRQAQVEVISDSEEMKTVALEMALAEARIT